MSHPLAPEPSRPRGASPGAPTPVPDDVLDAARGAERVVVLSGAGMSAESGVPTFRDAHEGLWERFDADELVTAEAWECDRALVWAWHWWLARLIRSREPHAGHLALAAWAARAPLEVITQNVDDLHERAGAANARSQAAARSSGTGVITGPTTVRGCPPGRPRAAASPHPPRAPSASSRPSPGW